MNKIELFKALANPIRLDILSWLKNPELYFPEQDELFSLGVCVGQIQQKCGNSFSSVSEHLALLQKAGLLTSIKKGQWTYYKRDEDKIAELVQFISSQL